MLGKVQYSRSHQGCAGRLRVLLLALCTAMLTLVGPGSLAFARAQALCETEAKSQTPPTELVEHFTILRVTERTQAHVKRRALNTPTGSCAGDRTVSIARHTFARPIAAEHAAQNGFGGPLRR